MVATDVRSARRSEGAAVRLPTTVIVLSDMADSLLGLAVGGEPDV